MVENGVSKISLEKISSCRCWNKVASFILLNKKAMQKFQKNIDFFVKMLALEK